MFTPSPTNILRRRLLIQFQSEKKPYDAEIEYLQCGDKQYIDTLFTPTTSSELDVIILNFGIRQTSGRYLMGTGDTSWTTAKGWIVGIDGSTGRPAWNCKAYTTNATYTNLGLATNQLYKFQINSTGIYIDDVLKLSPSNTDATPTQTIQSFLLFKLRPLGGNYNSNIWKMGRVTIKENGVVVRDFVPCRVGQVGYMYDKVSGQLFGNSGTGDFILGPYK